ncbi:hypothetical protein V1478_007279 [Vespula squamosa]|uniref:Uncharacterized protein n=1 Tax=Vespula squamosa TaxID=30214 RepID=A0ABD2B2Q9_VESSQ
MTKDELRVSGSYYDELSNRSKSFNRSLGLFAAAASAALAIATAAASVAVSKQYSITVSTAVAAVDGGGVAVTVAVAVDVASVTIAATAVRDTQRFYGFRSLSIIVEDHFANVLFEDLDRDTSSLT